MTTARRRPGRSASQARLGRLSLLVLVLVAPMARGASAQSAPAVRAAVARALPALERSAAEFVARRACVSCHHNVLPVLAFHLARQRGFDVDARVLDAVEGTTFRQLRGPGALDDAVQGANLSDPTPNDSSLLMAAHAAGLDAGLTAGVYARRIARWQRGDGHWVTSDFRPPHSSSTFTATATAVRALAFSMPAERAGERDAAIRRARQWLHETRPASTEDAAFRLMGLAWAGAPPGELRAAGNDLRRLQRPGGGWSQLPEYETDAYSTGEALFALHEAGVPATDRAWQKGLGFLLSTQAQDGTWRVRTRMLSPAEVSPPYFPTGFPYGKDEFLSYAGSSWAVMALMSALPEVAARAPGPPQVRAAEANRGETRDHAAPWVRAALFGTASELGALLDAGLDPGSRTDGGTTLLMAAAPDADKVRLLVARGANVRTRSPSGTDALTVAASSPGTNASLRWLLDAGAQAQADRGVRVRHPPLVLASMAGDLDNVTLLLARGADASAEALAEAVTFGHAEVVRALTAAGADVHGVESSGINLLHWAAITNRAAVIPALVAAGVPVDGTDEFGFTPLMYASTIDHGDTATLKALLAAGASRRIRNAEGRTPLEQARYFKLARLTAALR